MNMAGRILRKNSIMTPGRVEKTQKLREAVKIKTVINFFDALFWVGFVVLVLLAWHGIHTLFRMGMICF